MKTVFDNRQCAHIWAQQSQPFGHSDNMEFDGAVIKSYQTPIAAFVPTARCEHGHAVLISSETYSATTASKHLIAVRAAVRGHRCAFTVPDIGFEGGRARTLRVGPGSAFKSYRAVHKANLSWMATQYRREVARLMRSRDGGEHRLMRLTDMAGDIRQYREAFRVPLLKRDEIDVRGDSNALQARWERLAVDPKRQARAAQRQHRLEENERARGILRASQLSENTAKWRAGEYHGTLETEAALLRVDTGSPYRDSKVQTSWGASISIPEARAFAAFWARYRTAGFVAAGEVMVGPFPLREIKAGSGDCVIGCHTIKGSEIEAAAAIIGEG